MDINLHKGDLQITKVVEQDGEVFYDFTLTDDKHLIRRSLETPYNYLSQVSYDENGRLIFIDDDFGNKLYKHLGEPLSSTFITQASQYIRLALSKVDSPNLIINNITVVPTGLHQVSVRVSYSLNNQSDSFTVDL